MSDPSAQGGALTPAFLATLAAEPADAGAARLRSTGHWTVKTAWGLAHAALDAAEVDVDSATAWLRLAGAIAASMAEDASLRGQIAYAQARVAVHRGELGEAEALLQQARAIWDAAGDAGRAARSRLGLTQVLAMQGRFDEAEEAVSGALAWLATAGDDVETLILLARGQRNMATLLAMQDRHAAALPVYAAAQATLARVATALPDDQRGGMAVELGHLALNSATAYTFLDRPTEAERALLAAIDYFTTAGDRVNRGRAATNLARLYSRAGDYAAALQRFEQAAQDLAVDATHVAGDDEALAARRLADELLLEQALAYIALNLLPEAERSLATCAQWFGAAGQPYEMAQTAYAQGLLASRSGDWAAATGALTNALQGYRALDNPYWSHRTQVALAQVALLAGDLDGARAQVQNLPAAVAVEAVTGALTWDAPALADAWLVRLHLALREGDLPAGRAAADAAAAVLEATAGAEPALALPHLALRLVHGRGLLARAQGDLSAALDYFAVAAELLEAQRAALPADEVRVAFLDDKTAIYADWVATLLALPVVDDQAIATAFEVVERARSRALLERLLAVVESESAAATDETATALAERRTLLRTQLSELYNRLIGESGSRHTTAMLSRQLAATEAALQAVEWRTTAVPALQMPVTLADLQAHLGTRQQALVYYIAGEEVMAFVITHDDARVVRRLCTLPDLSAAQAELRFQLGRMEMDAGYIARRRARLLHGAQAALGRLYALLVEPLAQQQRGDDWLILPYGPLHLVPFHALWDGSHYLVERVRVAYAPSAAVLVYGERAARSQQDGLIYTRFAGFAPADESIPAAALEVMDAANQFPHAQPFVGAAATLAALRQVVDSVDVLHLATHGLFRVDNAFFSALKLADGWLDLREIQRLPGMARLVVLSACESGAGIVRGGDEVIGLVRGFLAAGAENVVASLWNVHDRSAETLMNDFYTHLLSIPAHPATALSRAQQQAIAQAQHPYYWAPFVAIG